MSKKTNVDELAELPLEEIEERIQMAAGRVEQRIQRCNSEQRDLTDREADLCSDEKIELSALKDALQLRRRNAEQHERMSSLIGEAIETRGRPEDRAALNEFAKALRRGVPARVQVECRSITSANAGARGAVALEAVGRPQWLYQLASIPFTAADSLTVSGPLYDALVAQSATAEAQTKP